VAYDEDLEHGLRNLEEILQRLDNRVKDAQWVKEHASPETPARIKEAIIENFPQPKAAPPPAEPPVAEIPAYAPLPQPVPEPVIERTVPPPAEIPAPVTEPAPEPAKPPETEIKVPQPLPKLEPPALPSLKDLPAFLQKAAEPLPEPEAEPPPAAEPEPAPLTKPARKPFVINRTAVIVIGAVLAAAGVGYQLTINSAKYRYAAAGELVKKARNAEAISAYSRIITKYPRSLEAAYSAYAIGDIKAVQGDIPAAIEHYENYLVAAPDKDPRIASARFKIAELELKDDRLADAEYLYQNAAIQASEHSKQAAERVDQIRAVKAQLAEAKKLVAKTPAKAVEAYSAVVAAHPKYDQAIAGLQEARDALAAANRRPAAKRRPTPKPKAPPALTKSSLKAALTTPPKPAPFAPAATGATVAKPEVTGNAPPGQAETCPMVWLVEQAQGQLSADMMFTKVKFKCDELKQKIDACKEAREAVMALQGVPPEARLAMELEIDPDWTLAKQTAEDDRVRKNYETRGCAALLKSLAN